MTATAEPSARPVEAPLQGTLGRADGVELLGAVHGCGYRDGAALVRRGDGQMVQLGPLMYALLECVDGRRDTGELAEALSERLGRRVGPEHVRRIAEKLAAQGLLAGSEHRAPPRRNPLLALRWKVLVTNPKLTRRLTAPFTFLFSPWLMWPILACFAGVFWFVLIHKGVASATTQALNSPGLLLLVFVLAVVSAAFHELGHAAACRYGGATPGGMGMGLYLVWPAFYTDVTDTYRLPRRARLRVDLAGLYFNAVVAVLTMAVWLVWRADALLLLVALQVLQMLKQLSPIIRADGYHILSDATGVPDLYAHMGPTLRRLLPGGRREPSALTGWARLLVTAWVLIVVPVLLSLMLGAVLLLPRLTTSAWESGRHIAVAIPHDAADGSVLPLLAALVRLLALALPVAGSALVTQKIARSTLTRARDWSSGRPARRVVLLVAATAAVAGMAWAWWPSGQYQPLRATRGGTLAGLARLVSAPVREARPGAAPVAFRVAPGRHLAVAMIPVGGATRTHPALFVIPGAKGRPPVAILSTSTPKPPSGASAGGTAAGAPQATSTMTTPAAPPAAAPAAGSAAAPATAFPFRLPSPPGPHGTQALALNTTDGGVTYDVSYALVTVAGGAPVDETNSAYALADCRSCTTVAVSFQVVLVVGQTRTIAPINAAGALNYNCPACTTTAIADQIVVTLKSAPTGRLLSRLERALSRLDAVPQLGAGGSPAAVAAQVAAVQQQIQTQLADSGLLPSSSGTSASTSTATPRGSSTSSTTATTPATTTSTSAASPAQPGTSTSTGTTGQTAGSPSSGAPSATTPAAGSPGSSTSAPASQSTTTSATTTTTTAPSPGSATATTSAPGG